MAPESEKRLGLRIYLFYHKKTSIIKMAGRHGRIKEEENKDIEEES